MKIKNGIVIRQIEDKCILVDTGKVQPKFNGMIKLNETSKDIIDLLTNDDLSIDELINKLLEMYDVDKETLITEVDNIITQLKETNINNISKFFHPCNTHAINLMRA